MHSNESPSPKLWRTLSVALAMFLGISSIVVWCWYLLDQYQQREYKHGFDLNVEALGDMLQARMRAYEAVLRGVSGAFISGGEQVSLVQWEKLTGQLRVQELYPGISSLVWSSYVRGLQPDRFPGDYKITPETAKEEYLRVKFISPTQLNSSMGRGLGFDLLSQSKQRSAVLQAIDSGDARLSEPVTDLPKTSSKKSGGRAGFVMYLPVYQSETQPQERTQRRATPIGMTDAAIYGDELAQGVFAARLRLFHIIASDVETGQNIFDSQETQPLNAPSGWQPMLSKQVELPLYGRTWRLSVSSTPEYEQALVSRSQDLVLLMGLSTAILVAFLAGAFVWQRDKQTLASGQVESKLRAQAEQLMLANRYKTEFLANMSHELRTPLNSILILSDRLRQNSNGSLSDKQMRHADIVYRAGRDLLGLINDVLDLAKVEAGRMQISMEPTSLQDLLVDLDASMRPLADAKGLQLYIPQFNEHSALLPRVFTDPVRLHQILRNLLSNAIKFTNQGQVQVMLSASEKREDGTVLIRFIVRDTGIGIAPEQHQQAFEAFQQLDGSTRRRHGGTGLGLAISRQLAKALGGDIELQSASGQGSTFTVHLPMQVVSTLAKAQIPQPQREGQGQAVLIVEDDANFADIIAEQVRKQGLASVRCVCGLQALELLKTEQFAAVVLDILLPDISGWQLFRKLRAQPVHRHTPVHIISCLPQPAHLGDLDTHYLTKPIQFETLEAMCAELKDSAEKHQGTPLLLVEDVQTEREHYQKRLTELGFHVTTCEHAAEAQLAWQNHEFAVLVLDLNLPDSDGFALLEALNEQRSLQGTKVVINTGLDVSQEGLQRLSAYSAVVVRKKGDDTAGLGQAVQGFLTGICSAQSPAALPEMVETLPAVAKEARTTNALQGRRLLIVDDDIRNMYAMSALLDEFGLDICTATNGEEAIARFQQDAPDLILMDMSMPVMDGYTATNFLKKQYGCNCPIIALTAHAMKGDREKCLAAGADDYMTKPVDAKALRHLLELWLLHSQRVGS